MALLIQLLLQIPKLPNPIFPYFREIRGMGAVDLFLNFYNLHRCSGQPFLVPLIMHNNMYISFASAGLEAMFHALAGKGVPDAWW